MSSLCGSISAMCIGSGKGVRVSRRWRYLEVFWPSAFSDGGSGAVPLPNWQVSSGREQKQPASHLNFDFKAASRGSRPLLSSHDLSLKNGTLCEVVVLISTVRSSTPS